MLDVVVDVVDVDVVVDVVDVEVEVVEVELVVGVDVVVVLEVEVAPAAGADDVSSAGETGTAGSNSADSQTRLSRMLCTRSM